MDIETIFLGAVLFVAYIVFMVLLWRGFKRQPYGMEECVVCGYLKKKEEVCDHCRARIMAMSGSYVDEKTRPKLDSKRK